MIRTTLIATLSLAATSAAGDISLGLPLACDMDSVCFIQQTVDRDTGPGAQDFTCGPLSYDEHSGTDFALPSLAMQAAGVDVLAAAPGTIQGVRNDMPDVLQTDPAAPDVTDRECGNGLVIRHADGWETQYCHMAQGSLTMKPGDNVATGDVLGRVGLSGETEFPHLHLSVRRDGAVVDPFAPSTATSCGPAGDSLWSDALTLAPGGLIAAGFRADVPAFDAIKAGTAAMGTLPVSGGALVVWGYAFGGQAGDLMVLQIAGPEGTVFDDTQTLDRTQAQLFRAGGRRTPPEGWPPGDYTGTITLQRDGMVIDTATTTVTLR
ncbi:Peptidase family M23 [Loktanella fryxellensis]|uniref:Peptidase family M23 n=1 Tax=Loktanella fryxellensis TaxID=245187 RepID=A0A1H8DD98_9RHOB|nr:M23 family metallopeptidase [Loktanella fryxellensis]SEN04754.1 Peptidase family M23 [Loktanella fryxellensis]